ncbi:putative carboxylesterase [Helianthus debilis subsp. tardiflorus]
MLHTYFQGTEPIGPELAKDRDFKAGTDLTWKLASKARVGLDDPMFNPAKDPRISKFGCSRILMCDGEEWVDGRFEMFESKGERHVFFLFNTSSKNACALRKRIGDFINPILSKA